MLSKLLEFEPADSKMIAEVAVEIACRVLAVSSVDYYYRLKGREGYGGRSFWATQIKRTHLDSNPAMIQRFYELGQKMASVKPVPRD